MTDNQHISDETTATADDGIDLAHMPYDDLPNPPAVTSKSFSLKDLNDCLNDSEPAEDATLDKLTETCLRNHEAILQIHRRTALLAWKTGKLLNAIKKRIGHGNWENHCKHALGVGKRWGFSKTTVWRWMTLYKRTAEPNPDETLIDAYRRTGLIDEASKSYETVAGMLSELAYRVGILKSKLTRLTNEREQAYVSLIDDEIDESAMELLTTSELELNSALKSIVDAIDYRPATLYEKYPEYQEHIKTRYFQSIEGIGKRDFDPACLPDCILTEEQREYLRQRQGEEQEQRQKDAANRKRESGLRAIAGFRGRDKDDRSDW